jgi:branched-chain amino acid transport system substrate-binding protein
MRRLTFAAAMALAAASSTAMAAETVGPVTDEIGVVKVNKGQPILIGGYWVISGPDTALGLDSQRAAEVYFADRGNEIAGHPIRFIVEDDQCNAEGGQNAATKLAANQNIVGVLGPACSSAATPAAPILWKAGMVNIGTATTAPRLTSSDRGPDYDGFARTIYSDSLQGAGDAKWMYETQGWRKAATIHDGSPYAEQLVRVFEEEFKKHGGEIVASEAVSPTDVDMRPVLTRVASAKPEVVYFPIFVAAAGHVARQMKDIQGFDQIVPIGGGALFAKDFITAAGDSVVGFKITFPDVSVEAMGEDYPKLVATYKEMFGEAPIQGFHAHAYDAARILSEAIEKVAVTDDAGNTYIGRKALRDAVFATPAFDGISGPIKCDEFGQCGQFTFAVYEFTSADADSFEPGVNPKKIYTTSGK